MIGLALASGVVALGMAWAIGAQDVSNALGTAVGSKAISVQQAIVIGAVCEFAGALIGGDVAQTISKGIVNPELTGSMMIYCQIMFCTLFGAFVWLAIATKYALPVSTSHSLVGSLLGLGLIACPQALNSNVLSTVIASWLVSPTAGAIISFMIFYIINRFILQTKFPLRSARNLIPYFWGFTVSVLTAFSTLAGPSEFRLSPHLSFACAVFMFVVATAVASRMPDLREKTTLDLADEDDTTEKAEALFIRLMIVTACVVSFAHGSNDVSNSIGPFAAIIEVYQSGSTSAKDPIPLWILVFGGFGIVLGLATYGYKVMATIGEKITKLTYSRGFAAQIATALTVLTASVLGLSVSTTHCLIGAIAGLAMVEGNDKVNKGTLKRIAVSWVVTLPASATFSLIVFGFTKVSPI